MINGNSIKSTQHHTPDLTLTVLTYLNSINFNSFNHSCSCSSGCCFWIAILWCSMHGSAWHMHVPQNIKNKTCSIFCKPGCSTNEIWPPTSLGEVRLFLLLKHQNNDRGSAPEIERWRSIWCENNNVAMWPTPQRYNHATGLSCTSCFHSLFPKYPHKYTFKH